jgi:hypothetical protein
MDELVIDVASENPKAEAPLPRLDDMGMRAERPNSGTDGYVAVQAPALAAIRLRIVAKKRTLHRMFRRAEKLGEHADAIFGKVEPYLAQHL